MMPAELPINEFELVLQNRGDQFYLNWHQARLLVVALSIMEPTFFDLAVSDTKTFRLCYGSRVSPSMQHSGDLRQPGKGLCHFVRMLQPPNVVTDFVLYVSGYKGHTLSDYKSVMLMIPDYESRILRVIPAPLDPATVGSHRGMMLVGLRWLPAENRMVVKVLDNPVMFDEEAACQVVALQRQFEVVSAATPNEITAPTPIAAAADDAPGQDAPRPEFLVSSKAGLVTGEVASGTVPVVFDADSNARLLPALLQPGDAVFVCGSSVMATVWRNELEVDLAAHGELSLQAVWAELATGVLLPHLPMTSATLEGPFSALLVRTVPNPKTGFSKYCRSAGRTGRPALVIASSAMEEGAAVLQRTRVNGLCIIDATRNNTASPEAALYQLSQVAGVCRMGPVSATVAALLVDSQICYYFMGGVSFPGLFGDKMCSFGQLVTEQINNNAKDWLHGLRPDLFSPAFREDVEFRIGKTVAFFQDRWVTGEEVLELFRANTSTLLDNFSSIELLLAQLRRALPAQELGQLVAGIMAVVTEVATAMQQQQHNAFAALLAEGLPIEEVMRKRGQNRFKKSANSFLRMIAATTSEFGVYTQHYSLAQQQRKAKIAGNVAAATSMTQADLQDFLTETCPTSVGLAVNPDRLKVCYESVVNEDFSSQLARLGLPEALLQLESTYFDPDTLGSLLEIASSGEHPLGHIGPGQVLAVQDWRKPTTSVIFLPLLAERLDLPLSSADVANEPDIAKLRILLRNTLVSNRALGTAEVGPQAKDIGWFLLYIILNALLSVTARFGKVPQPELDSGNSSCEVVRGLMWLLATTLASGANPMSMAYQIFIPRTIRPDLPRSSAELSIYWVIARTFKYLAPSREDKRFNLTQISQNLSRWLVRFVINRLMQPFLSTLRVQAKAVKSAYQSPAWYYEHVSRLNAKYYPSYRELVSLAEDVAASKTVSEEQWVTCERLRAGFEADKNFLNRRYNAGTLFVLFRFLDQVKQGKTGENTFQNLPILTQKIRRKWEPRQWAVPLPRVKSINDSLPFPEGAEKQSQREVVEVVEVVPDTPVTQLAALALTAAPEEATKLVAARQGFLSIYCPVFRLSVPFSFSFSNSTFVILLTFFFLGLDLNKQKKKTRTHQQQT